MVYKLGILGADGNMGQHISRLVLKDPDLEVMYAYTIPESPQLGQDLGALVSGKKIDVPIKDVAKFEEDCKSQPPDCIIDFTIAKATEKNALIAVKYKIPIVIGTTGLSQDFLSKFEENVKNQNSVAVVSSNMATGVNIFFKIAAELAKLIPTWDIEIIEAHHHRKRDAPSGTALTVAKRIADVLNRELDDIAKYGREKGPNPRKIGAEEIGIHAIRAGDIVGDHTVLYAGPGERIELVHRAHSRECFASGTLTAAKFLMNHKNDGKIYNMQDVLGLNN